MNVYERLFHVLNQAKVRYLVVGGVAVNLHGYPRFSADVDLLLFLEKDNLKVFGDTLRRLGYAERLPVPVEKLADRRQVKRWMKEKNLKAFSFVPPSDSPLHVDIIVSESLQFDTFAARSVVKKKDALRIPVVSIHDLIQMKKRAGRPQDKIDIEALQKLQNI